MRPLLVLALTFASLPVVAAPASPLEVSLEIAPAAPRPGDRVYWVGRVRNATGKQLFVPAELRSWLRFDAFHRGVGDNSGWGQSGRGQLKDPPPIDWVPLAPGDSIEAAGDVGEAEPRCRKGCPEGTLIVSFVVEPDRAPSVDEAGDHVVPARTAVRRELSIAWPTPVVLERMDRSAVRVEALGARGRGEDTVIRARFTNATATPLWIPKPERFEVVGCSHEDPAGAGAGGSARTWHSARDADPRDWVLLRGGKSVIGELACTGVRVGRGGVITIQYESWGSVEFPRALEPPFVWSASGVLGPVKVER